MQKTETVIFRVDEMEKYALEELAYIMRASQSETLRRLIHTAAARFGIEAVAEGAQNAKSNA